MLTVIRLPRFQDLRTQFDYCAETGVLRYRKASNRKRQTSSEAGWVVFQGEGRTFYRVVTVEYPHGGSQKILAHRVIWKLMKAEDPPDVIDHIDGDGLNNRWENMRDGTDGVNAKNALMKANNTSGVTGVRLRMGKWEASCGDGGKSLYVGRYESKKTAAEAVSDERRRHGYTERHGSRGRLSIDALPENGHD